MKSKIIRLVSLLLAICMCLAMLPQIAPRAEALSMTYTPSSAYKSSKYYTALQAVELTGNQVDDIINVALSQAGYCEGSYSGDTGGAYDSNQLNYVEYNYWYNKCISSGMPVGGSYAHWCATFVSWCAEQAGVPTSILQRSTAAGHSASYFNLYFYAGGSTLASSSDNNYHFSGYNYKPKKGDLFYTRSWSHVGLVVSSDGTYVQTIEGNTNDDGSANGYGVFRRTRRISDLYFGIPNYEDNSVKEYVGTCTYYPAHCQVTVTDATPINSQPRSVSSDDNSYTLFDARVGQTYTATALYMNTFGNYWYRIETDYDEPGYLYAGDSAYVKQITSDITLTGSDVPNGHVQGQSFGVSGTIEAEYNQLSSAACYIYSGFGQGGNPVTGYSDSASGKQYGLSGSNVDYNTTFGSLSSGNYTYEISANYINYYAADSTTRASNTGTVQLLSEYFVVIPSSASQSSCSHSYTTTYVGGKDCTQARVEVKACSKCGLVNQTNAPATGHSYGAWTVVNATCTVDGYRTRKCSACGDTQTEMIPASHDYNVTVHPGNCKDYATYEFTCGKCGDNYKLSAGQMANSWLEEIPEGMDPGLFESKTQYRYSDYETKTSNVADLAGYTLKSSKWVQSGTKTVNYVKSWNSGFNTSSSLYSQYNKQSSKVTASETNTSKTVIDSDAVAGYLWFHWCTGSTMYSTETKQGSYTNFHAFYSTTYTPSNYDGYDASDGSYKLSSSTACSNCVWYWPIEVYAQKSTSYNKEFTYERWTDFSPWSDTAVSASSTRKVESRTVYQLKSAELGTHSYTSMITKQPTCTATGIKTFTCSGCGDSYTEIIAATGHSYTSKVTAPTCTAAGYTTYTCSKCGNSYQDDSVSATGHEWQNGHCFTCGEECIHNYQNGFCAICGMEESVKDYYLFGWINGADYACEGDYANMGEYKFVNGKLIATFESDSYVGVKTSNNRAWYVTNGWLGYDTTSTTLYNADTIETDDKLYVPGGVEVTFTLIVNADNTLTLSYEATQTAPTLELQYPTLLLEDEIIMSVYFTMDQEVDLSKVGMLTWKNQPTTVSYTTADAVIPGAVMNPNGYYSVNTEAIPAKNLGDEIYFCIYFQMDNGTYVYSKQVSYSPKQFAYSQLNGNVPAADKALMVAVLNYGAQAQTYLGYKTNDLVNKDLTAAQKALVKSYDSSMLDGIDMHDSSKTGPYANTGGFVDKYPTVSLDGAFAINYYFITNYIPDAGVTLFYWTEADYNAASSLSPNNATGRIIMDGTNVFAAVVEGIAAQDLDDTVYVVAGYRANGVSYCTGVLPYSIGAFCTSQASGGAGDNKALASAIAVYSYYAKAYFS